MRKRLYKLLHVLFIILLSLTATATDYPLRHYTVADGLPSNEVYHVFQDSKGYIWFGTDNGVARYDGNEFKVFGLNDGLPDKVIFEVFEDVKHRLWFVSMSGQLSYLVDNKIYKYKYNNLITSYPNNERIIEKNSFFVDSLGQVSFLARSGGLRVISQEGNLSIIDSSFFKERPAWYFVKFPWRPVVPIDNCMEREDILVYPCSSSNHHIRLKPKVNGFPPSAHQWQDKFIIHTGNYLGIVGPDTIINQKHYNSRILYVSQPEDNLVWVGLENQGAVLLQLPELTPVIHLDKINSHTVTSIAVDKEKGVWITTLLDGAFYLNPPSSRISHPEYQPINNIIKKLNYGKDSCIFISYWKNYFSFVKDNHIYHHYPEVIGNDMITSAYYDIKNLKYYLAGISHVYSFDIETNTTQKIKDSRNHLKQMYRIPGDTIWYSACSNGVRSHDGDRFTYYSLSDSTKSKLRVDSFTYDSLNNQFWLGTIQGIFTFDIDHKKYYPFDTTILNSKVNEIILHDNIVWAATNNEGLWIIENDSLSRFMINQNHYTNSIKGVHYYRGYIWVNAGTKLYSINTKDHSDINEFNLLNMVKMGSINDIIGYQDNILLGTSSGIYQIPINIIPNNQNFPLYITNISINYKDTNLHPYSRLPYNENNIYIKFTSISYSERSKKTYRYKLEGLNNNWTYTTNNDVTFHKLPPGKYNFRVQRITANSQHNVEATLAFTIKNPFYKTWWFILIASGLIIAVAFYFQYQKIKRVRKENDFREELLEARQKALINQINPHFIFNSLNSIQLYILDNNAKLSGIYLSKFARLIRISLEVSQQNKISLSKEIEVNSLYLDMEKLRFKNRISYEIINNIHTNPAKIQIPPFLIQPLLENALWHGLMTKKEDNGRITLSFDRQGEEIIIKITDNGIGRKAASELKARQNKSHKPMGISVSRRRLLLLSQQYGQNFNLSYRDLFNNDGKAAGTETTLTVPYDEIRKEINK